MHKIYKNITDSLDYIMYDELFEFFYNYTKY